MTQWNRKLLTEFIELYKEKPCLWKNKCKSYSNTILKNQAYNDLIELIKPSFPEADKKFVKTKIQSIRGAFRKERKKIEVSKKSGAEGYVPSLWYYDQLLFIDDQDISTESPSNMDSMDETLLYDILNIDNEEPLNIDDENQSIFKQKTPSLKRKNKEKLIDDEMSEFMKTCSDSLKFSDQIGEYDALGITVAAKLKKMAPSQQIFAEFLISKILTLGMLNKLSDITDITNVIPSSYVQNSYPLHNPTSSSVSYNSDSVECDENLKNKTFCK